MYEISTNLSPTKVGTEMRNFDILNALDDGKTRSTEQIGQGGSSSPRLVGVASMERNLTVSTALDGRELHKFVIIILCGDHPIPNALHRR